MSYLRTKRAAACAACVTLLVATDVAFTTPQMLFSSVAPPPHWQQSTPMRQIQPRNPDIDQTETIRILSRDELLGLSRIEIYKLQGQIQITKDPTSARTTGFTIHAGDGSMLTVTADDSGRQMASARLTDAEGSLVASSEQIGKETTKTAVALADGASAVYIQTGEKVVLTVSLDNGKPVFEVTYAYADTIRTDSLENGERYPLVSYRNLHRTGMKLYSTNGRLIYSDTMTTPPGGYGQLAWYVGTVYGPPNGQPSHRLSMRQSMKQDFPADLERIDVFADDGVRISSMINASWDSENQIPLSGFQNQADLFQRIKEALASAKLVWETKLNLTLAISNVLADRSK